MSFLYGIALIIIGFVLLKFPPKNVNGFYGYRTKKSMKSIESWNFAQRYSAKQMIQYGVICFFIGIGGSFINMDDSLYALIPTLVFICFMFFVVYATENALKRL